MITIKQLPSGWWAVFVGDEFFDAASKTQADAEKIADALRECLGA